MKCESCKTAYDGRKPMCPMCNLLSPHVIGRENLPAGVYDLMLHTDGRYYVIGEHGKAKH